MKTDVVYRCGHAATVNLTGTNTHGERDRKAAWLTTQDCPACTRQHQQDEQQAQNEAAAATAAEHGWPLLTGTPKQTSWATTIRAEAVTTMTNKLTTAYGADTADQAIRPWTQAALRQTEAAWWIDHRDRIIPAVSSTLTTDELAQLTAATKDAR
ncbi:hypothetical protein ABTX82_01935 [Streptomyces lavendulae]|uniref:hypothetical protein n=1 Tax=Streptomyces lavendulae TaxID=1914 RepID=UPI003330970F